MSKKRKVGVPDKLGNRWPSAKEHLEQ